MGNLEDRVKRLEKILGEVFRPGGTIAIRDDEAEAAAVIIGHAEGDIGSVLGSFGLSVNEPGDERGIVVTASGIGVKDDQGVLRILISGIGVLFLDEGGAPKTLITAEGLHKVAEA